MWEIAWLHAEIQGYENTEDKFFAFTVMVYRLAYTQANPDLPRIAWNFHPYVSPQYCKRAVLPFVIAM